jgi:membrane protein implicated in regulation of membrane protease activity
MFLLGNWIWLITIQTKPGRHRMELDIYIFCLVVGFVFTLGSAIFGHAFGGGHDVGHVDGSGGHAEAAGGDSSDMPGISVLSPLVIACYLTAFGGLGILFHQVPATHDPWISAPLALVGAAIIAWAIVWFLRKIFRAADSTSESRVADLVGLVAQVITTIPEGGAGEIAYVQRGSRYSAPARVEGSGAIPNGHAVKIVRIVGPQFFVIPI